MSTTSRTTPDPVEDRLRATLAAEADRHPVTPDFEGLRARGDRTVIDLTLPPRRNRARIVALAAALALLAGAVGAVVLRGSSEDDGEPIIADEPPATGYYLPSAGWEVSEIIAFPIPSFDGTARTVEFAATPLGTDDDLGTVSVYVALTEEEDPDLVALSEAAGHVDPRTMGRGSGDGAREYVISPLGGIAGEEGVPESIAPESTGDGGTLIAARDGRVLLVDWYGPVEEAEVVRLADRWWDSGGEAVTLDPATGLDRINDVTYPHAVPIPAAELAAFGGMDAVESASELYADAALQAIVQVESPDGWTGSYSLVATDDVVATGSHDPEAAAVAGLSPEEAGGPLPADIGGPAPAWESSMGITAVVPGGVVGVSRTSFVGDPLDAEQARELWAVLAPASHAAWIDAGPDSTEEEYLPDAIWGDTLAETDAASLWDEIEGESSSSSSSGEGMGTGFEPIEIEPRDGVNPAAGLPQEEVDRLVADTLLAFVDGGDPIDTDLFAPTVAFGYADEPESTVSVAIEEVAQGRDALDELDPDMETTPALDAWNVLWTVGPAEMTDLVGVAEGCPPLDEVAADPAVVVLLVEFPIDDEGPCADWSALVVRLDGQQQITSIEARFGPT